MPPTILEVDGKTITVILEQLRVVTKKFQRNVFAKSQVRLIDKKLASDPTKRGFYSIRTLRTLYLDDHNIESEY